MDDLNDKERISGVLSQIKGKIYCQTYSHFKYANWYGFETIDIIMKDDNE